MKTFSISTLALLILASATTAFAAPGDAQKIYEALNVPETLNFDDTEEKIIQDVQKVFEKQVGGVGCARFENEDGTQSHVCGVSLSGRFKPKKIYEALNVTPSSMIYGTKNTVTDYSKSVGGLRCHQLNGKIRTTYECSLSVKE